MAFPTTGVLDNFNRADQEPPLSASWSQGPKSFTAGDRMDIKTNQAAGNAGNDNNDYWNVATFGPDCEVHWKVSARLDTVWQELYARLVNIGSGTSDGYGIRLTFIAGASNDELLIFRLDNGALTSLGAAFVQEVAAGDSFGLEIVGSTLTAYYKPAAGSWTSLGTRTDATYSAAGNIGAMLRGGNTHRGDDFGGGTVVGAPAGRPGDLLLLGAA